MPSGASTGIYEALELRDGDKSRYLGKGEGGPPPEEPMHMGGVGICVPSQSPQGAGAPGRCLMDSDF